MNPTEAMDAAVREIYACKGAAIERAVSRAIGASAAFVRIGVLSVEGDLYWRQTARIAGIDQQHKVEKGAFVWGHNNVQQLKSPGCEREWTIDELQGLGVPYASLMECPECHDIMIMGRVDTQKV